MAKKKASSATAAVKKSASKPKAAKLKAEATTYGLKVGDKAPAITAANAVGGKKSTGTFWTVLYFYPKDMTSGCTLEGHDFARLYKDFTKIGCEVYGVSRDSVKSHEKFIESCNFPFALLSDADDKLCRAFDVVQMKSMYGRKYEGIERSTFIVGPDKKIRAEWRKVKVPGHAEDVLAKVRELQAE